MHPDGPLTYLLVPNTKSKLRRKQYNTKLKQWGFIKNISGTTASWMVNKAKARKRQGLETEFTVGGQLWTMDRIERSAKRAKSEGTEASVIGMCLCTEFTVSVLISLRC
jgi:hypothetical protein